MSALTPPPVDLGALRRKLAQQKGPAYWRSLDELAETPAFIEYLKNEFPRFVDSAMATFDRRRFLQLMAASLALGGLGGCGRETNQRQLWPYVVQPPGIVPGRANYYATATGRDGFGTGVVVKHEMARPLKVEGNPDHPASLGGSSAIDQASILGLYDPHRAQTIVGEGRIRSWQEVVALLVERRARFTPRHGEGLRLLTGTITSPTLAAQIAAVQSAFPQMRWHQWDPLHRDSVRQGAQLAFGRVVETIYDLSQADIVVGVESDLLTGAPGDLRYARDFAARRRAGDVGLAMSRVYALEATPTLLGAKADHRAILHPDALRASLRFAAASLGAGPSAWRDSNPPQRALLDAMLADLNNHRGRSLLHAGREQPADIHAVVHAINGALGNFGHAVRVIEPVEASPTNQSDSLRTLAADMTAGKVDTLLILGINAVYAAPADVDFGRALGKVPLSLYLGEYADETAALSRWHVPATHTFEAWSDIRAYDGTVTIQQPQTRPLYGGHSPHEILAVILGDTRPDDYTLLRTRWQSASHAANFDEFWFNALRVGVMPNSASPPATVAVRSNYAAALPDPSAAGGLTLLFRADLGVWDGRFAENGWLQEMSRPFTRLTWDNAALVAPATAERLGLVEGDVATIKRGGQQIHAPVWILPGQAADCVTLHLGYGRRISGPVARGVGFDAYALRSSDAPWQADGAQLDHAAGVARYRFAAEQHHSLMDGVDLVREAPLAAFVANPQALAYRANDESLYPAYQYDGIAWAMSIDLNSCIGCQACVVACQAENNIPVVGKDQVAIGRIMHWLRIDRYYSGGLDNPAVAFQPVPCMHCENAPCEVVCPVQATVHDHEGVNVMVYNRCVGTRFCSNNCPYKVRRFNFLEYSGADDRPRASWNPDVTVRDRGVMEKCTYCVQRTRQGMIAADKENRRPRDGEVVTACQQACPTQAIVFGDRNDKTSAVAKRKASPLDYPILADLNTRPRTTYTVAIRNPSPAVKSS